MSHSLTVVNADVDEPGSSSDELLEEAERAVLGFFLTASNAQAASEEIEVIEPKQFYLAAHEVIFDAVQRSIGTPDIYLRVLDRLIGTHAPRALNALDRSLAAYLSDCVRTAECFGVETMRHYAGRVREAYTQRQGRALIAELARTFASGNVDATFQVWSALGGMLDTGSAQLASGPHRNTDLLPYMNGTHKPLSPSVGGLRDDNRATLYPGLWHTVIAPTTSGKSWFALWHCVQEIRNGNTVAYAHFEETSPAGTIGRIRQLAPDLSVEEIVDKFHWLDCSTRWNPGEFAKALPDGVTLVVLDGINAACGQHGWIVDKPEAVGAYRALFVTPATLRGAAVISCGHPVKSVDRQNERHGFGATGWLDEVNGAGFRLVPSKKTPIGKGRLGHSTLWTVKDREGGVEAYGTPDTSGKRDGWYRVGSFKVDNRPEQANTSAWLNVAVDDDVDAEATSDPVSKLAAEIVAVMSKGTGRFAGTRDLQNQLARAGVAYSKANVGPAIQGLAQSGRLAIGSGSRGQIDGVLTDARTAPTTTAPTDSDPPPV